ncbi:MAG: metal-sensitive transcriptional regulator [Firmicutes bacterium]|nr:metal-sensitive transcriptional regulator [Bacillota bacterium]
MNSNKKNVKSSIINRLKRIEGQVKGIQRMVDEDKCCEDIMIQISAIRSAINKVGGIILDTYIKDCLIESLKKDDSHEKINDLLDTIVKYVK